MNCCRFLLTKFFNDIACKWCDDNGIVINANKSNYLSSNSANNITINGQNLENCTVAKYLGVYFDNKLFWNSHVD